jgi:hypothetical protein
MKIPYKGTLAVALVCLLGSNVPAYAHNEAVHSHMVDLSYEIMKALEDKAPSVEPFINQPPANVNPSDWSDFLTLIRNAPKRYRAWPSGLPPSDPSCPAGPNWAQANMGDLKLPVDPMYNRGAVQTACGAWKSFTPGGIFDQINSPELGPMDFTGTALGFWAANVDAKVDDGHMWFRPQNAGGAGAVKGLVNDAGNIGIAILLAPFICLGELIAGDPSKCWADAKDAADTLNPFDEIDGSLPGFGDVKLDFFTGMWHHIQVVGGGQNDYDDHQGLLLSHAGPFATLDVMDISEMVILDALGVSINYNKSLGPKHYESKGGDGMPATTHRSKYEWQFQSVPHTPFEPVDNLAQYGWSLFRDPASKHLVEHLGFPLHAIGDATVPMHVAGTPAWGHRPFEDAAERIWHQLRLEVNSAGSPFTPTAQATFVREILVQAFQYHMIIKNWRANNPNQKNGIPIRQIITTLAQHTANHSMAMQGSKSWPFNATVSMGYFFGDKENTILHYANFPNAADLYHPILVDGTAATVAFLTYASEVL